MDNIIELKNYTMSKSKNKQITLNYLNNNNITYYTNNNTIISFPINSIQNENLHCIYTKLIQHNNQIILIHNYTN